MRVLRSSYLATSLKSFTELRAGQGDGWLTGGVVAVQQLDLRSGGLTGCWRCGIRIFFSPMVGTPSRSASARFVLPGFQVVEGMCNFQ
jgi:hypothetical protein